MTKTEITFGEQCFFYGKYNGYDAIKKGIIVGPWNKEFPEYVGINDLTGGGFCYIEADRLFYSINGLRQGSDDTVERLRVLPSVGRGGEMMTARTKERTEKILIV